MKQYKQFAAIAVMSYLAINPARSETLAIGPTKCFSSIEELLNAEINKNGVKINNFNMERGNSLFSRNMKSFHFSASGVNRTDKDVHLDIQLVGYRQNNDFAFIIVAKPMMSILSAGKNEEISGDSFEGNNPVTELSKVCIRVIGDF
ncbi:hypothetical protein [Rhodoblastus acidophilus]|uniref:hypothetical protein n=1 Tax=Rhodoblastus acidophilus TaxID=1074 RepID=UPI0011317A46|nr:hypothetical protein [Rhodoblastus acidophilus]